jgi:hypothetical protein
MWTQRSQQLASGRIIKVAVDLDGSPVSYAEVLRSWQSDPDFRSFFIRILADSPFAAYRWETPHLMSSNTSRPFEFVMLDSSGLARAPDVKTFAEHFRPDADGGVVEFPNTGKDAILVVPCPLGPATNYGHLAAFTREAPEAQQHALWKLVGSAMQRRLSDNPVWLSTAGAGVSWLHVRLDDRPKYYGYAPYR